jgi:hypothetical protein
MIKNLNFKNFKKNLRQSRLYRSNFYFRRNNKYNRNKNIPVISNKPITLGTGTATLNVTKSLSTDPQAQSLVTRLLVNDILSTSSEYVIKVSQYSYVKINYIKIITFPSLRGQDVTNITYLYVNWVNDNDMTLKQIENSDNVKIIPVYQTRNKVYTFIPPNVMVGGYNPRIFHSTQVTPYQGSIYFAAPLGEKKFYRIEINLIFRGARDYQLSEVIHSLNELKIKREKDDKEKQSKEEINDNIIEEDLKEDKVNNFEVLSAENLNL